MATAGYALQGYTNYQVRNLRLGVQSGSTTVFATWEWPYTSNTDHYEIAWRYYTGDGVWFLGQQDMKFVPEGYETLQSTYNPPSNATKVSFSIKPVAKTYPRRDPAFDVKTKKKVATITYDVAYWKASKVTEYFTIPNTPVTTPAKPSAPGVVIDGFKLTVSLTTYDPNTKFVEFQIVKNNSATVATGVALVKTNYAAFTCSVAVGGEYKARARGLRPYTQTRNGIAPSYAISDIAPSFNAKGLESIIGTIEAGEWSEYSGNSGTIPATPAKITSHSVKSTSSIQLNWQKSANADTYTIEYATSKDYFDRSGNTQSVTTTTSATSWIVDGLEAGQTWFFRVRANNSTGNSGWSAIYSVVLSVQPAAPTTWSETVSAIVGDAVRLYWMHNSEDGSSQSAAQVEITVNGVTTTYINATPDEIAEFHRATDPEEASYISYLTKSFNISDLTDSSGANVTDSDGDVIQGSTVVTFPEGAVIQWRVRTKGIHASYSPWSTMRTVIVYAQPSIELEVSADSDLTNPLTTLTSFPLYLRMTAQPTTQAPTGWNLSILSNQTYETADATGTPRIIGQGEEIYSEYISSTARTVTKTLSAGDISFEDDQSYTVVVTVAMNSGLTAESASSFRVDWEDANYSPNAEVSVNPDTIVANISPYCEDLEGNLVENVVLSVYRREYDGKLVEIATGLANNRQVTVTDPHPSLDYARYRIVAMSESTGQIGFYDMPGVPVGETAIIIQWDEQWTNYNYVVGEDDVVDQPVWTGSMLRLPYNVSISDSNSKDVTLQEYIGRAHPVSYYGTQLGVGGSWSSDIPRNDAETLYAIRRLAIYMGDVYVREPSGIGYWANVSVNYNRNYNEMLIPVSIDISRVEGGA